jgi:hypothetical protein
MSCPRFEQSFSRLQIYSFTSTPACSVQLHAIISYFGKDNCLLYTLNYILRAAINVTCGCMYSFTDSRSPYGSTLKMEAASASETSVNIYQTTTHRIPEECKLHSEHRENLTD